MTEGVETCRAVEGVDTLATLEEVHDGVGSRGCQYLIHDLEEITPEDQLHDQGIKSLFLKHRTDNTMAFIIGSEIYGHLEKVVDRFEDVANRINGILIEHL